LEVLLALLIISVGLMALVQSAQTGAQATTNLRVKTGAYHVADQVMWQLYRRSGLDVGTHQGQMTFADQEFHWRAELSHTDNNRIDRIDLMVGTDRQLDHAEARLTGFKKR